MALRPDRRTTAYRPLGALSERNLASLTPGERLQRMIPNQGLGAHLDPAPIVANIRGVASAFAVHHARFLVVGSYAVAAHGLLRPAESVEVWVEPSADNALRMVRVLSAFGIPLAGVPVTALQFPGFAMVFGCPPHRVEMTTSMSGLDFADAYAERLVAVLDGIEIPCLGLGTLVHHLHHLGDPRSLADADVLAEIGASTSAP